MIPQSDKKDSNCKFYFTIGEIILERPRELELVGS